MYELLPVEKRKSTFYDSEVQLLNTAGFYDPEFAILYPEGAPKRLESVTHYFATEAARKVTKRPIRVKATEELTNFTDGKTIVVSSLFLRDTRYPKPYLADAYLGVTMHECCHVLYTDFECMRPVLESKKPKARKLLKHIHNLIEDIVIEKRFFSDFPQQASYLAALTHYVQVNKENIFNDHSKGESPESVSQLVRRVSLLYNLLRPSQNAEDCLIYEEEEFFNFCIETLTPFPENTEEALSVADKIVEFLDIEDVSDEEWDLVKKLIDALMRIESGASSNNDSNSVNGESDVAPYIENPVGETESSNSRLAIINPEPDKESFLEGREEVKHWIQRVRRGFEYFNFDHKWRDPSKTTGHLDTDKFAEAMAGSRSIYFEEQTKKSRYFNVVLLIDESGSMQGEKIEKARNTAILLYEALKTNGSIETFIYGHTADSSDRSTELQSDTIIVPYKELSSKFNPHCLGSVYADWNNRDGAAIEEVMNRVRKQSARKNLLIVLSDGQPAATNYNDGVEHTREVVNRLEREGVQTLQIHIGRDHSEDKMFKHRIVMEDYRDLPQQLMKELKKMIKKLQ